MTECIRILQCANTALAWPFRSLETVDEQIKDLSSWTLSVVSWWLVATLEGLCWGFPHFLVFLKVSIPELFGRSVWNIILWNPKTPLWIQILCARQETCESGKGRGEGWEQVAWWEVGGRAAAARLLEAAAGSRGRAKQQRQQTCCLFISHQETRATHSILQTPILPYATWDSPVSWGDSWA